MRLSVINGSPRFKKSNTDVFLQHFLEGFTESGEHAFEHYYIYPRVDVEDLRTVFETSEIVLLAFPLYADAMPSGVLSFIQELAPLRGKKDNPSLLYFVQSGFPEPFHSRPLERYLKKLTLRLSSSYLGCIIKGGGEGVKEMPAMMNKGTFKRLRLLGKHFSKTGSLDEKLIQQIAGRERLGLISRILFGWLLESRLGKMWWHNQMKANDCLEEDDAKPYASSISMQEKE